MDKFQYLLRREEWKTLTTDNQRGKFIRDVLIKSITPHLGFGKYMYLRISPHKTTLALRLLRNCFRTYDYNQLPDYIPATVFALIRR